jgi:hypothetical protein
MFFSSGAPVEADAHFRALLNISLGSPVKEPCLTVSSWNPSQRDAQFLEPSFIHLSKSQVYEPPPPRYQVPIGYEGTPILYREMPLSGDFLNISSRSNYSPYRIPFHGAFSERTSVPRAPSIHFSKSPVHESSSRFSKSVPMERSSRLQSFFYIFFRVPGKGALPPSSLQRAPTERDTPTPEPRSTLSQSPR